MRKVSIIYDFIKLQNGYEYSFYVMLPDQHSYYQPSNLLRWQIWDWSEICRQRQGPLVKDTNKHVGKILMAAVFPNYTNTKIKNASSKEADQ